MRQHVVGVGRLRPVIYVMLCSHERVVDMRTCGDSVESAPRPPRTSIILVYTLPDGTGILLYHDTIGTMVPIIEL